MATDPGRPPAPDPERAARATKLTTYVRENAGRYTDAAITAELTRAGYPEDEIRAALAAVPHDAAPPSQVNRAIVAILVAYGVTFALLSVGMLANVRGRAGYFGPDAGGGILILAGSLGIALFFSLAWVGSRRAALLLLALMFGLFGIANFNAGAPGLIGLAFAVGLAILALRRRSTPSGRTTATLGLLLSVPVILLGVIAGLCVATGLPLPSAG